MVSAGVFAGRAAAQTQEQIARCENKQAGVTPEQQIGACTAVIESRKFQGKAIAWALNNRGGQYRKLGLNDLALEGFRQSLLADPGDTDTFYNRCCRQ